MAKGAGIFDRVLKLFRVPGTESEPLLDNASKIFAGPRGRKIVYLRGRIDVKRSDGRTISAAGLTNGRGDMFIARQVVDGDPRALQVILRHEKLHSLLTPKNRQLNYLHGMLYKHSKLYVYLEEAAAQAYGTRNLRLGLEYPLKYGYVTPLRLAKELAVVDGVISAAAVAGIYTSDDR